MKRETLRFPGFTLAFFFPKLFLPGKKNSLSFEELPEIQTDNVTSLFNVFL
jgi:hypothetical protein